MIEHEQSVDVIVVTHNSSTQLLPLVQSLWPVDARLPSAASALLVIVDSGSEHPEEVLAVPARSVFTMRNYGYGVAANAGLQHSAAEWVALVNPDCRLKYTDLQRLAELAATVDADVIAPSMVDEQGNGLPHFERLPSPLWARTSEVISSVGEDARVRSVAAVLGAAMLLKRESIEAIGGFDPSFFLYAEEIDLCMRVRAAGGTVVYSLDHSAIHIGEGSSDAVSGPWRRAQRARGKARLMRKHYGGPALLQSLLSDIAREVRHHGFRDFYSFTRALVGDPRRGFIFPAPVHCLTRE